MGPAQLKDRWEIRNVTQFKDETASSPSGNVSKLPKLTFFVFNIGPVERENDGPLPKKGRKLNVKIHDAPPLSQCECNPTDFEFEGRFLSVAS